VGPAASFQPVVVVRQMVGLSKSLDAFAEFVNTKSRMLGLGGQKSKDDLWRSKKEAKEAFHKKGSRSGSQENFFAREDSRRSATGSESMSMLSSRSTSCASSGDRSRDTSRATSPAPLSSRSHSSLASGHSRASKFSGNFKGPKVGRSVSSRSQSSMASEALGSSAIALVGEAHNMGQRPTMEDEFIYLCDFERTGVSTFLAVYDGHGGRRCVDFVKQVLHRNFAVQLQANPGNVERAFHQAFEETDRAVLSLGIGTSGCTACCCYMKMELGSWCLYTAHVGDTRAVLSCGGTAKRMTALSDHRPTDPLEAKRIMNAGGYISHRRVNGALAVTRAFGDHMLKEPHQLQDIVTCIPDVTRHELTEQDEFFIIACDGLWDVMADQEAVQIVHAATEQILQRQVPRSSQQVAHMVAQVLVKEALLRGTLDNVTCAVVFPMLPDA